MADENRIQDPFSLIPEEEKEDLVQDILGLDQSTGLIKEDDESFFDTMLDTPGVGFGPLSIKQTYQPALSLAKALSASVKKVVPNFRKFVLDQQYLSKEEDIRVELGIKKPRYSFGVGFGEGAASRMIRGQEQNLLESARAEQEEIFNSYTPQKQAEIVNNYIDFIQDNADEWNELQNQIDSINKTANLSKTEKALSAGFDSLILMTPAILGVLGTKNPVFIPPMLAAFGYYEMGSSYRQARMSGLGHDKAVKVSTINALSEIGTEAFPMPFVSKTLKKYWKANGANVETFIRDGFGTAIRELGAENVNTIIQETNNAISGVNTDLRFAWSNKDNPNYDGPSWIDVMLDNAAMTSIATVVGAGGMIGMQGTAAFAPDIKAALNELDPNIARRIGRELDTATKQVNASYKSIDETYSFLHASKQFDPGARSIIQMTQDESGQPFIPNRQYYNFVMPEVLPDEYLAQQIIKNDPVAESLSEEEIELANQLQQEISDLDGNELADALVEGKKVLNIMGVDQLIDPETFNQDVSQRIIEINGQINATENETTISKLEEDKSVLTSYLNRFKKPINNFQGPVVEPLPKKEFGSLVTSYDEDSSPQRTEGFKSLLEDIQSDTEIIGPINLSTPTEKLDQTELSNIQKFIVDSRQYSDQLSDTVFIDKKEFEQTMFRYRDLDQNESANLSSVVYRLQDAGMPMSVFENLDFIGVMGKDERGGKVQDINIAEYLPGGNTIGFSGFSQIGDISNISQMAYLSSTLAHELGHHLDYRYGTVSGDIIVPLHYDSPLFEIPEYKINTDPKGDNAQRAKTGKMDREPVLEIVKGKEGSIITEAFDILNNGRLFAKQIRAEGGRYYDGLMLEYPLSSFSSMMFARARGDTNQKIIDKNLEFLKGEIFAQMHALYYTNRKLMEQFAPETIKLIERIYDAISVDGTRNKSSRLFTAVQSPRAGTSFQIFGEGGTTTADQSGIETEPAGQRMAGERISSDRIGDGLSVQGSNYIAIGDLSPKSDGTFDGAPRIKPGVFKNTQKDFDNLAKDLVKLAEQKDLSLIDESRNWYKNVNEEVDKLVQGNAKLKEDVMRLLTVYSSQTPVETNLAYTLRSLVAMAKGADPLPGFQPEAGKFAKAALEAPDFGQKLEGVGWKLQSFYENLTGKNSDAVTMDTWMFKLLGFAKGQGQLSHHRYGTAVIKEATKIFNEKNNDNLSPMEMQAVLWTYVRNKQLQEQGKPAEYVGYETFLEKASSIVTAEVIPTQSLEQFAFAEKLSDRKKAQMTKELLDVITTSEGRNEILNLLPGTGLYKFSHSFGAYDGKINPNIIANLILEKVEGEQQFSERDLEFADDFLRSWGYVFRQDAVPYFSSNENILDEDIADLSNESVNSGSVIRFLDTATGDNIEISSMLRKQINAALQAEGIDGFTQMDASGISIINFKFNGKIIEDFDNKIERAMSSIAIEGVGFDSAHGIKYNTQYLTNNWRDNPDGEGYLQGRLAKGSIRKRLDGIRSKVDAIYDKYRNESPERGPDGSFPTTGSESSARGLEPLASKPVIPKEQSDAIDAALDNIEPPTPPAPPKGPDPDGNFSLPELSRFANYMEGLNITVANKFGKLWTIEESILEQFGNNAIVQRLKDVGVDPDSRDWRVSTQTDIFPGRVKDLLRDIREDYYEPLLEFLTSKGISEEQYNHFIYNLHAPERNAYLPTLFEDKVKEAEQNLKQVQKNPDSSKQDIAIAKGKLTTAKNKLAKAESGSGITTEDAVITLKKYGVIYDLKKQEATGSFTKGKNLLKAYEDFHRPLLEKTREILSESGLIAEELIQDWSARYKYYVPLVGYAEDTLVDPDTGRELKRPKTRNSLINSQMTVSGQLIKAAKGRESLADSPLQQSIVQATGAAITSEKNRVVKSLAELARAFPSDLWSVSEDVGQIKKVDAAWDSVKGKSRIGFKENGEQKYVEVYDERLARGFDNFDSEVSHIFMKGARAITRYLSMVNTSLDPAFMVNNFLRDVQTGYFNLMAEEEIDGGRAKALEISKKYYTSKNILSNAINLVKFEKSRSLNADAIKNELDTIASQGTDITPEVVAAVEEKYGLSDDMARKQILLRKFKEFGGETGYIEQKTIEQLTKEFQDLRDMYSGNFKGNAKSAYKSVFAVIERLNSGIENAARFTAFEGYIESFGGLENATPASYERAAALAKNLTINFNRMGTMGPTANALYMFFNASIQGTVNVLRGLKPGQVSSRKLKVLAGLYGVGNVSTIYNILVSGEDEDGRLYYDKISEWEKQTKYIFLFPNVKFVDGEVEIEKWGSGSKYNVVGKDGRKYPIGLGIPMPYGYAVFANTGRVTAELMMGNILDNYDKSLAKAGLDLGESLMHNYAPISVSINEGSVIRDLGISVTPTFAKPAAELLANRDHFGTPIYFEPRFGQRDPRSYNENKRVLKFIQGITRSINDASGGNEFYSGDIDIDPAVIQYLLDYATGGIGRTTKRSYQLLFSPDRPRSDQIPFLRRLTVSPRDSEDMQMFYENIEKVKDIEFAYRQLSEALEPGEDAEDFLKRVGGDTGKASLGNLLNRYATRKYGNNSLVNTVEELLLENKKLMQEARQDYYEKDPVKYYKIYDELDLERLKIMKEFNGAYFDALEEEEKERNK